MKNVMKFAVAATPIAIGVLAFAEPSFAATVGQVASNLTGSTKEVTKAVGAISTAAGFIMALVGALKFKAHKDNPQQTPLSMPIVYLVIAGLLLFLPGVVTTVKDTFWGSSGAKSQGIDGSGLESAIQ